MAALQRATTYVINHPDEAWEIFKNSAPDTLDNELNRRAWGDTLPRLALRPSAIDEQRYEAFGQFMLDQGLIEIAPDVDSYTMVAK